MKKAEVILCHRCQQPFHGQTACRDAASPRIQELLAQATELREKLGAVEQELYDLNYEHYCYITGVIKRQSEER